MGNDRCFELLENCIKKQTLEGIDAGEAIALNFHHTGLLIIQNFGVKLFSDIVREIIEDSKNLE